MWLRVDGGWCAIRGKMVCLRVERGWCSSEKREDGVP